LGVPSQAHSEPLINHLKLESLQARRADHYSTIVDNIIKGVSHPYFKDIFSQAQPNSRLSFANNKLNDKRLSRFGLLFKVNNNSIEVITHPLNRSLLGHPITSISSKVFTTATALSSTLQLTLQPPPPVSGSKEDFHKGQRTKAALDSIHYMIPLCKTLLIVHVI